jgi:hypothetical protein
MFLEIDMATGCLTWRSRGRRLQVVQRVDVEADVERPLPLRIDGGKAAFHTLQIKSNKRNCSSRYGIYLRSAAVEILAFASLHRFFRPDLSGGGKANIFRRSLK